MNFKTKIRNMRISAALLANRFRKEASGVAAIEFALIAPIMFLLFIGTMEVSSAVSVNRKISRISSTVGDLITQANTSLDADDIEDIMRVAEHIMRPYSYEPSIKVTGISVNSTDGDVEWSCTHNAAADTAGSSIGVPARIRKDGTFLVQATVSLAYQPIVGWARYNKDDGFYLKGTTIDMEEVIYLRPRISSSLNVNGAC